MNELIEDALALVDERETEPQLEAVDLAAVAEACWGNVRTGDATLDVRTDQHILADESQLRSLLENCFRNAVEHGGAAVTVTVGALDGKTDAGDGSAGEDAGGFYVEDDGRGFRGDPETALEYGFSTSPEGSGLGLSIVTEVAENHGWRLRAAESATGGARFEVTGVETHE
jgi:signal transduction histidine kinase